MNVLILGATGMVGQAVLRECLLDEGVTRVVTLGRSHVAQEHSKLRQIVHADLLALAPVEDQLTDLDACFYCVGVSAVGLSEAEYTRVNHDVTLSVAATLARLDPGMTFVYVSGAGTDSSERGRVMWARVKGRTENALLRLPFRAAYMLRPGAIVPMHGVKSRTFWYRVLYAVMTPVSPLLSRLFPRYVTTSERVGKAMLRLARSGYRGQVLENREIDQLGDF
ncbi:MAG TPA: NAD-dependent epimerase/dehydratase family protein [Gemmatimonadaceae bacterium]|nr:NAD-dependent epimerase/dehydratase family protein [Gemmatimonadaceae bacterium]